MNELKPCPFCGAKETDFGEPVNLWMTTDEKGNIEFSVDCQNCGANIGLFNRTEEEAIEAWNRRVNEVIDD